MAVVSPFTTYFFLSALYSIIPYLLWARVAPDVWNIFLSLTSSTTLIGVHTFLVASCNVVFALTYAFNFRKSESYIVNKCSNFKAVLNKNVLFAIYIGFCGFMVIMGFRFPYAHNSEMVHSMMSNAKTILAAIYVYYLVRYGFTKKTLLMFIGFAMLLVVEQSRWYFVSVMLATGVYLQNKNKFSNGFAILLSVCMAGLLAYVGVKRNGGTTFGLFPLLVPFYAEGSFGSYMDLQTYDIILHKNIFFLTGFFDYILDPILYIIPRVFYIFAGADKEVIGLYGEFIRVHQSMLAEPFAPFGGHYYVAQASSALPILGPLIITFLFAHLTIWFERRKGLSFFWELSYYLYVSGFMFVFIKTRFNQSVKYYLTIAIPAYLLYLILIRRGSKKRPPALSIDVEKKC